MIQRTLVVLSFLLFSVHSIALAATSILFDEAHKQPFKIGGDAPLDLSSLAALCQEQGFIVNQNEELFTEEGLNGTDVLVISGAFQPLNEDEIAAVVKFVEGGGGLAVMLHIAPPLSELMHKLEVDFTNGTLREATQVIDGNPLDFTVTSFADFPVTNGLESFSIYGSWALRGTAPNVVALAKTTKHGWVDLDHDNRPSQADAMQEFAVVVGGELGLGRFIVVGDDAVFQNRFLDDANKQLAVQMLEWLAKMR